MPKAFISACVLLVLAGGCSKPEMAPPKKASYEKTITIGLIPEIEIFNQVDRYRPLASYITKKTGILIKLTVLSRYGNSIDNFVSTRMDGAFFGSFTYALAHAKLGVEVLARPENLDGSSTYHGMIFVRKDSGIKNVADMRGKRFAFVDKATTAGYLLPLDYFNRHGVRDYKSYLKETYFAGTHEGAIYDVLNGKADIGAAKNTVFAHVAETDGRIMKELVILEKSPEVPENGLVVRKDLDASVKKMLKEALLGMDNDAEGRTVLKNFGVRRFIETTEKDYEPVLKYVKSIGLDLAKYDYLNE